MSLVSTTTKNVPKMSIPNIEIKNNYYVIRSGLMYNYYPIKVEDFTEDSQIIRFEKTPPIIVEGVAIVQKKLYVVTPQDLLRGVIRKSRELIAKRENVDESTSASANRKSKSRSGNNECTGDNSGTASVSGSIQHPDEQGSGGEVELEIHEAANAAWEEQVGSLLSFISEKEEWEAAYSAQP